jgi:hypothetical protein
MISVIFSAEDGAQGNRGIVGFCRISEHSLWKTY